ncbi:unnamed protein product [Acanthoscelides obtectus]|uniref:Uncharacterized protein n=1 Tax=Acanthoscelides obtectus TaxID=200917 RepID=A0A9P0MMB8_ACAOB|nr:unnamed protein product [Acanthoscelides obtectus]CAK1679561.1 hypothetical protein AOBTE_LOCUS32353 [Acanthoscelides obtectus]
MMYQFFNIGVSEAGPSGVKIIAQNNFYDMLQGYPNNDINKNWTMLNLFVGFLKLFRSTTKRS